MTDPSWRDAARQGDAAHVARARRTQNSAAPKARIDRALGLMTLAGLLALATLGSLAGLAIDRAGFFDPPLRRPLDDQRTLRNFRDSTAPIVGSAVLSDGDGAIAILRDDGALTLFDPETGLVTSDRVISGLESPLVGLSAGCGLLEPGSQDCARADTLHVLSRDGGLAERAPGGAWRIVLPDQGWIGLTGTPVQQDEVQSWAASRDGAWLAVSAGAQGVAVFDTANNRWRVPGRQDAGRAGDDVRIVPDGAAFWLIGGQGLGRLTMRAGLPVLEWSPQRNFVVRDLSVSPSGGTLAVIEGDCRIGGAPDCLTLAELTAPFTLNPLIGESARFPDLAASGLFHAQFQGNAIVTVGAAGVHAYDSVRREWRVLLEGRVDAFYAAERGVILATQGNTVWRISGGRAERRREAQGGPFTRVLLAGDRALGLARDGALRDLDADTVLLAAPADLPAALTFTTGASLGDRVLLAGPDGALLHDVGTRSYRWFPVTDPGAIRLLSLAGTRLYSTETDFWAVGRDGSVMRIVVGQDAPPSLTVAESGQIPGPPRSATASARSLVVVDSSGRPWRAAAGQGVIPTVGAARVGGRGLPGFAVRFGNGMAFADPQNLWMYNQQTREWGGPFAPPPAARVAGLAANDALYVVTESGDVWQTGAQDWQPLLFGGQAALDFEALTDASERQGSVFLGGQGRVQRYDPDRSGFAQVWNGGSGAVRIVDTWASQPVWLSGGRLLRGSAALAEGSVRGAWAVDGGILAEIAPPGRARHSMLIPQAGTPVCTRYGAPAPEGTLLDALGLGSGRVLAATTGGMGLHDPASRRWLTVRGERLRAGERLYRVGDQLVVVGASGLRARPLAQVQVPDSCAEPVITPGAATTLQARSLAFDESSGRAALLAADGTVSVWSQNGLQTILRAASSGPRASDILESAAAGPVYLAATADGIWAYDTRSRVWSRAQFIAPQGSGRIVDSGLSDVSETGVAVTVWTADGRSLGGDFRLGAPNVQLATLSVPEFPRIAIPADAIADVAMRDGVLAVTAADRVDFGRTGAGALTGSLALPGGLEPIPYRWAGLTAFLSEAPAQGAVRYLLPQRDLTSLAGSLEVRAFRYTPGTDRAAGLDAEAPVLWRIDATGAVLRCPVEAGQNEQSGCTQAIGPPPRLQAEDVLTALSVTDGHVIVTAEGVLRVNTRFRQMRAIAGPAPQADAALVQSAGLLLLEGAGGALWRLQDDQAILMAQGVQDAREWQGQLIVDAPGAALVPAADEALTRLAGTSPFVSFDWLGDQGFTLLDDQGRAVDALGKARLDLPLPNPETILGVLPEPGGQGLWVHRSNGTLDLVRSGTCERGPPHAPPVPCLQSVLDRPVSDHTLGRLIGGARSGTGFVLSLDRGTLDVSSQGAAQVDRAAPARFGHLRRTGSPASIRERIVTRPDGTGELAPPELGTDLRIATDRLARLADAPQRWDALSLDWIRWERGDRRFSVPQAGGNRVLLAARDLLVDGRLMQTLPGRGLRIARGSERYSWLNAQALWSVARPGGAPELVLRVETQPAVAIAGQRFLFDGQSGLDAPTGQVSPDSNRIEVTFGDLRITESLRERQVSARLRRSDGGETDGFAETGFVHDRRVGIGWRGRSLVVVTPAGILPAEALRDVDPAPVAPTAQRIYTVTGEMLAVSQNGTWQRHTGQGRWIPATDPFADRVLASEDGVVWTISAADGLSLTPETAGEDWRVSRQGLDFDGDRLVSLAGGPGRVLLGTPLGTHAYTNAGSLNRAVAASDPGPVAAPFDALPVTGGGVVLFDDSSARRVWDGVWRSPNGPPETPWLSRQAVDSATIRITLRQGASPEARRRVTRLDGRADWAAFRWERGRAMPFDAALSLFATPDGLWIGTGFGLRRATARGVSPDVLDIAATGDTGAGVAPVTRIGRPSDDPSVVLATGPGQGCAVLDRTQVTGPCAAGASLDRVRIHADALWQWDIERERLTGRYLIDGSPSLAVELTPAGYLTHDSLLAGMDCNGTTSELWADGRVLRTGSLSTRVPEGQGRGLLCQRSRAALGDGVTLVPGAYLAAARSHLIEASGVLRPLDDRRLDAAIVDRVQGVLALDRQRLRITTGRFEGGYEYRSLAEQWIPLPFADHRPAIDVTTDFRHGAAVIDRLTPAGVLRNTLGAAALTINADTLTLRLLADGAAWDRCDPQRLMRLDGDEHAIESRPGAPALLRCADGSAALETRPTADFGAFEPIAEDPTASATLIDRGPWNWTRRLTAGAPVLSIRFRDEPADLAAGRFPMDDLSGVAQVDAGQVDLVSAHGWWRHPERSLGADGARRDPREPDAAEVRSLSVGRGAGGAPELCLELPDRQIALSTPPRVVPVCRHWQGSDGFWIYEEGGGMPPVASALALNGARIERSLLDGRFSDLVAIAAPRPLDDALAVPVRDGVLVLDPDRGLRGIYRLDGLLGLLPAPNTPAGPSAVTTRGLVALTATAESAEPDCPGLGALVGDRPGERLLTLERRGAVVQMRGLSGDQTLIARSFDCTSGVQGRVEAQIDVADRTRHVAVMQVQPEATRFLVTRADEAGHLTLSDGRERVISLEDTGAGPLMALYGRTAGRTLLAVHTSEVFEIDVDAAITALGQIPLPVAPAVPASPAPSPTASPSSPGVAITESRAPPPRPTATPAPTALPSPTVRPTPTARPTPTPTPTPVPRRPAPANDAAASELIDLASTPLAHRKAVQIALQRRGLYSGAIDGIIGPGSRAAISAFQRSINAPDLGQLTRSQFDMLRVEGER